MEKFQQSLHRFILLLFLLLGASNLFAQHYKKDGTPDRRYKENRSSSYTELPVLLAIAFEQLPEIYTSEKIVFLKLPQAKINILQTEIIIDNQANEWTKPFQNIICRKHIPIEKIELMMIINLGQEQHRECIINHLTQIASAGQENYLNHSITERANALNY